MSDGPRPFVIGARETRILESAGDFAAAFARTRALPCRDVFDPELFETLRARARDAVFVGYHVDGLGSSEAETPPVTASAISLMLSRPELLAWVAALAGCGPLVRVQGTVVQRRAGSGHALRWHDDLDKDGPKRRVAITIDLSDAPYEGGRFDLRDGPSREILATHQHDRPGSALLFAVERGLQHRLLPVTAGGPRRVYSGWFFAA